MRGMSSSSNSNSLGLVEQPSHTKTLASLLPMVWPADRPDLRLRVIWAFVALIFAKVVTVGIPIFYKGAVDWLTTNGVADKSSASQLVTIAIVPVMLIIAYGVGRIMMIVFNQIRDVLFTKVGQNAVRKLAKRTFEHLHRLSLRFHLERRTGGLSRVIERGNASIELIIRMGILNTIPTAIELAFVSLILLYYFGWQMMMVVIVTIALYVWFTFKASEWRIAIRRDLNDSDTEANSKAIDSLLNYETVKYFGNEKMEADRFDHSMSKYEAAAIKAYESLGFLNSGQIIIFTTGLTICMLMAANGVAQGTLTVGDFVMVNALLIQLYQPLNFMGMIYREIKQGLVDIENMFSLLGVAPEIQDAPDANSLVVTEGVIKFENVSFSYDASRQILKDVSFEVPAGKMIAIVGPSGAGKSTISRILFRFYEVTSGTIKIDDQEIRNITQESLRHAIGMVPQDTVLFNDTLEYNIRYGKPDATEQELQDAIQLAQLDGFISNLPDGLQAMVGERGLKLSGGEKQRVAIARTLLKNPPVLMLDEATSALDSHTEKEIQDALDKVSQNRTTLVIAHRLSTIVHADEIIVLEKGVIVERGNHSSLISKNGLYASMWARQREAEQARERLANALEAEATV